MKRISLHLGINKYDREYYGGDIDLNQCMNDAERLYDYTTSRGISATLLTNQNATVENFTRFMTDAAKTLKKGDFLFVSDSSHGTYDDNIVSGKIKRMTAICLHDGIFWDYEMRKLLMKFRTGVTVVWLSDCCFAESNWRFIREQTTFNNAKVRFTTCPKPISDRVIPKDVLVAATQGDKRQVKCKMFTYASSNIYQVSYEDERGGVFTTAVLECLKKEPGLTYYQLWKRTSEQIAPLYPQSPVFENVRASTLTGNKFLT